MDKIKFRDLSLELKILVVFGWIMFVLISIAFLSGFIEGFI